MKIMHETIRSKLGIDANQKRLIDVVNTKEHFMEIFEPLVEKRILVAHDSLLSDSGEINGGYFRGGLFKEIKFYYSSQTTNRFDGHIWFSSGFFAIGLSNVYDIMESEKIDKQYINSLTNKNLKIFKFRASSGSETEESHVLHANPFLAFKSLLDSKNIRSCEQILDKVIDITPGVSFYNITYHRE